ncbi:hypothetical protein BofuT4_uP006900.1 [Botrytis cinerea T4]|uniref:Uncharacterized protein n=1 Tax=Botryotinia fuckeliana (strain T4) TaxID=999810 RepID=G2Y4E1_BOTF4|nr:hypothetical protein BofuT4_uP006900.1 [Botrytis cinerea T4]
MHTSPLCRKPIKHAEAIQFYLHQVRHTWAPYKNRKIEPNSHQTGHPGDEPLRRQVRISEPLIAQWV